MNNTVKKFAFIIFLLTSSSFAFGQQLLWSTIESDSLKELNLSITVDKARKEVMELYDMYELYYDLTGYSKESYYDLANTSSADMQNFNDTELTIVAVRNNFGKGSGVIVAIITKSSVNMLLFSNSTILGSEADFELTSDYKKVKFEKWYNTLLK